MLGFEKLSGSIAYSEVFRVKLPWPMCALH